MIMEVYRVDASSPEWLLKAYDYVRTDAFCFGQNIPVELEFAHDDPREETLAIVLTEAHKPVAGCRITYPEPGIGKIGRVCVVREKQRSGAGRKLIREAEKWILEQDVHHIVINSHDRAAAFYHKLGYVTNPDVDPEIYERQSTVQKKEKAEHPDLGFRCVLVEKYLDETQEKQSL